jgi:tight adherence protein C
MSAALVLAALAGVAAAAALVEALATARERPNVHRAPAIGGQMNVRRDGGRARPPRGRGARLAAALGRLGRRAGLPLPTPADLQARIQAAGLPDNVTPADAMAVKGGAALAAALAALPVVLAAPGRLGPVLAVAAPAGAFLVPDLWLARRARRRAAALTLEVADVLDLLRVAVAAGLAPTRALAEVGRRRSGLLGLELATTAGRINVGVPRAEAYARLRARCPLPAIAALAVALQRADREGAPLAPLLRALAVDARAQRARALQDRAAKAAPKIQLVVALLLVPAVMLLITGALVDQYG